MNQPVVAGGSPVRKDYLIFGSPDIRQPEIDEVVATLKSGWIGTGPRTAAFEDAFRQYTGSKYARAVNSCTAALHLTLLLANLKEGDEVITTPMTFAATANAILHARGRPVFADCEWPTGLIAPNRIEAAITPRTRVILPVHLAGRPCDMDAICDLASRRGLLVISDAAHAIETRYKEKSVGTIGDAACFSFYVTKNVTTAEGGMITTEKREWSERIEILALHGQSRGAWKRYSDDGFKRYEVVAPGFKYNMTDVQASLGLHQLARVEESLRRREAIWAGYDRALGDLPMLTPRPPEPGARHARHLYQVLLDVEKLGVSRDQFQDALHRENIGSGIHYVSIHLQDYYRRTFGCKAQDFPNALRISERTLSLPLSPKLTDQDVNDVVAAVRKLCAYYLARRGKA